MSHQVVGHVIHHLLTDETLRVRFAIDPLETIADLMCQGCELTEEEVEVFVRTDAQKLQRYELATGLLKGEIALAPSNH